jgi:site-specific recombinase XerC
LLACCAGKDFRDRRDIAIMRLFLDTGMRLEDMGGLRYSADDAGSSDVDLRSRVVRIIAKGRREMVLPIGTKAARTLTGISAPARDIRTLPTRGAGSARRAESRRAASTR